MGVFNTTKPALLFVESDTFLCAQVLRYWANNGDLIEVPILHRGVSRIGMLTDGGSKPLWSNPIVGDRCDELMLPYVLHDNLFVRKGVIRDNKFILIDFDRTQELLDEMIVTVNGHPLKKEAILKSVGIGGRGYYNSRKPCNTNEVDINRLGEDWGVIPVRVIPDFDVFEGKEDE